MYEIICAVELCFYNAEQSFGKQKTYKQLF